MTEITEPVDYEPVVLHECGEHVPAGQPEHGETLSVWVARYPHNPGIGVVVSLGVTDGDGGPPNMWFDLTPDVALTLADQLQHHAAVARDFQTRTN